MSTIDTLFYQFAAAMDTIESIRAENPALAESEKMANEIKAKIQDYSKTYGTEHAYYGWGVKLSSRKTWDTKALEKAHPELKTFQKETIIASVSRVKVE